MTPEQLYSKLIKKKAGYKCEYSGKQFYEADHYGLDCAHFFGRDNESVRFYPDNGVALDHKVHMEFHGKGGHKRFEKFMKEKLGKERWDALVKQNHAYHKKNREAEKVILNKLLKELE